MVEPPLELFNKTDWNGKHGISGIQSSWAYSELQY